ncbi:hypothetical protein TW85_06650 [Marinomonas sp. S3726]|uniref:hypothetical protein n=1 Tax=Marinomonas sp. S3726 TaxID=579484 RepID=UPI0005FA66F8|nr:hypothetical protein [Marinomonas sp. S3726]KJZ15255.1 hypothetical protein TW85_06650 [Marinomonas sp. S3726]
MKKIFLVLIVTFSNNVFALNSFDTEWSAPTKVTSIAGYSEASTDSLSITFSEEGFSNPRNCSKQDFYMLSTDGANRVGQSILSIALASGAANLDVQYKVYRTACIANRPIVTELKVNFR